ncbi:MAG: DUF6088 family protein [Gammaproteobacteria bacterium]|nr:DUF6088 family protein [Gammaproteobacteria bacterium]MDE0364169.1 DUF6088 family protein [Gammaproteobacteria bacterium]
MSIAAQVYESVMRLEPGRIFGCSDMPGYRDAPLAVVRALGRLADKNKLKRLAKGRYYVPKEGMLGFLKPADSELVRNSIYRNGRLIGYVTGVALYNRLGLTTQTPKTVTVAINGARQQKDYGTIRIKLVPSRAPVRRSDVPLLQYLDALRDLKKIPDAYPTEALELIAGRLSSLTNGQIESLQRLALKYYNAATRAVLGLILSRIGQTLDPALQGSLNPLTRYDIGLDSKRWADKSAWFIR